MSASPPGFESVRDRVVAGLGRRKSLPPRLLEILRHVTEDAEISSVGLDSLSRLEIVVAASEALGVELRPSDCEACRSFGDAYRVWAARAGARR